MEGSYIETYFLMGLPFIATVLIFDLVIARTKVVTTKRFWLVLFIMLIITAVFDQFLTGLPVVHYNEHNISGIRIWHAPIEDFMYTIAAVIGIGSILTYVEKRETEPKKTANN